MNRMRLGLFSLMLVGSMGAYEIPAGVSGMGELEKVMADAATSRKPIALVVAIKKQPET